MRIIGDASRLAFADRGNILLIVILSMYQLMNLLKKIS